MMISQEEIFVRHLKKIDLSGLFLGKDANFLLLILTR